MDLIARKRILGEKMMISRVVLEKGFTVASHRHENEQFAVLLSGVVTFGVGEEGTDDYRVITCKGGDTLHLPSNVPHSAEAIEQSIILDLFSPPSEKTGIDTPHSV